MAEWTLDRLIHRAEGALRAAAVGRKVLPTAAYFVDGDGELGTLAFPVPVDDDDSGRDALAALLAVRLGRAGARMWVLALPTRRRFGGGPRECALLDGHALGGEELVRKSRLLRVERRRGAIVGLHGERTPARPPRLLEPPLRDGDPRR